MKYLQPIGIAAVVIALIALLTYNVDVAAPQTSNVVPQSYDWSLTGESFVTTFVQKSNSITGAKDTHTCLAGNDESCFMITVWSGNYASYFNAYRISKYEEMMSASGSTVTVDDLKAHLKAGYTEVKPINGNNNIWHLVDIGYEGQHMYIERPWGTLIVTDLLGLKGPSYEDRKYISLTEMPSYIVVK